MLPEQLYREAIHCFDALIDISHNTDVARDFASRNQTDLKYLVDGANFVISKMHFNPENNYYVTLGIPQSASPDEIKERWKRLMLLYHPDRQAGQEDLVSERAKKVNEAYNTLKDDSRRNSYNRKLIEETVISKPASRSQPTKKSMSRNRTRIQTASPAWERARRYFPRMLVALYILIALSVIGFIYFQNSSSHLETALLPKEIRKSSDPLPSEGAKSESPTMPSAPAGDTGDTIKNSALAPLAGRPENPQTKQAAAFLPQPVTQSKKPSGASSEAVPAEKTEAPSQQESISDRKNIKTNILRQLASPIPSHQPTDALARKDDSAVKVTEAVQKETARITASQTPPQATSDDRPQKNPDRPVAAPVLSSAPASASSAAKSDAITKEEIDDFIRRYISAYEKNDLNALMLLFSRSAVENNTMDYTAIRNAYRETFSEKINYYKLTNIHINLDGPAAYVNGNYSINRYSAPENKWATYKGTINWRIARENDSLKIIRLNYDN